MLVFLLQVFSFLHGGRHGTRPRDRLRGEFPENVERNGIPVDFRSTPPKTKDKMECEDTGETVREKKKEVGKKNDRKQVESRKAIVFGLDLLAFSFFFSFFFSILFFYFNFLF